MPARMIACMIARTFASQRFPGLIAVAVWSAILLAAVASMLVFAGPVQAASAPSEPVFLSAGVSSGHTFSPQGQPEPAPPSPLIYLDVWLFGGLVLLVALIVAIKYLWKAFQPDDRDPSEGLQPWERPDYDDE